MGPNMTIVQEKLRGFFPEIEPRVRGRLKVSDIHELYYEESGNPQGLPVVVLHGGPGGGSSPNLRRFHDPAHHRIITFDQRGCGRSTPHACLEQNSTWDLVEDMEKLRHHLGVDRWQVFGGSWGSTLALSYALKHPGAVRQMILRGIFTVRKCEVDWFYQHGASMLFPEVWERFVAPIPPAERHDLVAAHYKRLTGADPAARLASARAWSQWEGATLSLYPDPTREAAFGEDRFAIAFASIECHYFINRGFFERDGWLLANAGQLRHIPAVIIQGRYDVVTPVDTAYALHRAWPDATFEIIADAGHAAAEPNTLDTLIRATDSFAHAKRA
jgi:proline iminopeptidase